MICPDCENGKAFHPLAHVKASKDYGKYVPCTRCNGSGIAYCCDGEDPNRNADLTFGLDKYQKNIRANYSV